MCEKTNATQPIWELPIYGDDDYVIKSDYALDYAFIFHHIIFHVQSLFATMTHRSK